MFYRILLVLSLSAECSLNMVFMQDKHCRMTEDGSYVLAKSV
jgi:hypothetical protein